MWSPNDNIISDHTKQLLLYLHILKLELVRFDKQILDEAKGNIPLQVIKNKVK